MQLRPRSRFVTGAWSNTYTRGKKGKRPDYTRPGQVVDVTKAHKEKHEQAERALPTGS